MDKKNTTELLEYIIFSIALIEKKFKSIRTSDDFLSDVSGLEKLDAISMRLQTIGEAIKKKHRFNKFTNCSPALFYTTCIIMGR